MLKHKLNAQCMHINHVKIGIGMSLLLHMKPSTFDHCASKTTSLLKIFLQDTPDSPKYHLQASTFCPPPPPPPPHTHTHCQTVHDFHLYGWYRAVAPVLVDQVGEAREEVIHLMVIVMVMMMTIMITIVIIIIIIALPD